MSGSKKSELEMRDKAILHQQRRLKQATQFSHKDSADLLPLDGLKRLGTSKDLQPHSIVQRRLLEGNITRLRGETRDAVTRVRSPLVDSKEGGETEEKSESTAEDSTEERESPEESERSLKSDEEEDEEGKRRNVEEKRTAEKEMVGKQQEGRPGVEETERALTLTALVVRCKCCETEVKASINTGCQHNSISLACCRRLGLMPAPEDRAYEQTVGHRPVVSTTLPHTVEGLQLQLGRERTLCSACVVEDEVFELSLGLHTLLELKCCVDLSSRVLRLSGSGDELPFLDMQTEGQFHHDNNKNTTM
ncbi:hypothetical protein ANANG_G00142370 [Anguilla anguilla]|uniref:Aspartic peptidase DDI1-type domain-containing protein n=1 Tax=Anguilla anguilla TaxID=7936 RepID=A0A9D3MDY5_ANGAN|nr:hypothetical protein ANANG_G00142370 [Anguilla anguilla]